MKSQWKITSNYIGDKKQYAVYRTLDTTKPDHSGNREVTSGYTEDRQEAEALAERMNKE